MITCIAIDDEPLALDLLEDNISKVPFLQLTAKCDNAIEAIQVIKAQPVDLVFLDIQMPGLTGLQFIRSLTEKPMFIIITAYEKYALQGFDLDVIDYLVKPVSLDRFIKAANKAEEQHRLKNPGPAPSTDAEYFFVNVDYSLLKINFSDISWIEGLKDYIKIHLHSSPKPVITRMTMKTIEEQLPSSRFIRIHKSFIVSIASITSVRKNNVFIGPLELTVSENYQHNLRALINRE